MKVVNNCKERGIGRMQKLNFSIEKKTGNKKPYLLYLVDLHRKPWLVASKFNTTEMILGD